MIYIISFIEQPGINDTLNKNDFTYIILSIEQSGINNTLNKHDIYILYIENQA